ncbi:MAG TPA: hypothetical protein VJZ72_01160 [Candidatus Limnocylindrales bacterium]|nr:hypothetical protein [Candidatus Limnocylindrales bacterium]
MEELRFSDGRIEVVVLPEIGARIHRLRAFGHDLLRTPSDPAEHRRDPFFWGAYVMAPWGGRIDARPTALGGRTIDIASNFPDGTAIHGQVYDRPWGVDAGGRLRCDGGDDGWPWRYGVAMRVAVADAVVTVEIALTNRAESAMPAGLGLHPWFLRPLEVAIDATHVFGSNTDPPPRPVPVEGAFDRRVLGPMPADLDATWADLAEPQVRLRWPDCGVSATMRVVAPTAYIVAASPASLDAIAVEPQTHAPGGIRRLLGGESGGLALLAPGESVSLRMDLAFDRSPIPPASGRRTEAGYRSNR